MQYEYDCEIVDKQGSSGAENECNISSRCGQLFKSLTWRDRCHSESEATIDNESKAKWQGYQGSVAAL